MYYSFHNAQIINSWVDEEGHTHIMMADTYDFNKNDNTLLTQVGSAVMDNGVLNPYFMLNFCFAFMQCRHG